MPTNMICIIKKEHKKKSNLGVTISITHKNTF